MSINKIINAVKKMMIISIFFTSIISPLPVMAEETTVKIGVLANRGYEQCRKKWEPTINYLTRKVAPYKFELVPLDFKEIIPSARDRKIDFIICNSAIFVDIEAMYSVTAIATLRTRLFNRNYAAFGGVIFARADNTSIKSFQDLKGKIFLAADRESLGGWQVQWRELKKAGIDPFRDFAKLSFSGQHDAVVFDVLKRKTDAGACRTGILESLASAGKINLTDINVIAEGSETQKAMNEFPLLLSTRLYPEWPIAKLFQTSPEIASRVSLALQNMKKDDQAAVSGEYGGWSYPLNYKPVQDLQMELQIGYYKRLAPMSFKDILSKYWREVVIATLLFIIITIALIWLAVLYRQLSALKEKLDIELLERKKVEEELRNANIKLEEYANTDALTQVANRRKFDVCYAEEWRRMSRDKKPLSLIIADIDHFKKYNDFYGHQAGDKCLFEVAQEAIRYIGRPGDLIARCGGEEFAFILPSTDIKAATMIAERIRIAVETLKLPHEMSPVSPYVTISLGVASIIPEQNGNPEDMIKAADNALYEAKKQGRNRSIFSE